MKMSFGNILTIISILVAIVFGVRDWQKGKIIGAVHQQATYIINNNYFTEAPQVIKQHMETIAAATANTVTLNWKK